MLAKRRLRQSGVASSNGRVDLLKLMHFIVF